MRLFPSALRVSLLVLAAAAALPAAVDKTDVFVSGRDGYHTYRIPAILRTGRGTLLAFCEGRKASGSDTGDIDLLLKRSTDGGRTWSAAAVLWDDGANTCGNPCPVLDETDGTVWLIGTHNMGADKESEINTRASRAGRSVWVMHSSDDGVTWTKPAEITSSVKKPEWTWYATGPGIGIQIRNGEHAGRLVIPCDHNLPRDTGTKEERAGHESHAIYSDDHGKTWQLGGTIRPAVNECQVAELFDGRGTLLMNLRSYAGWKRRAEAVSHDGGETWSEPVRVDAQPDPVCQGSILGVPTAAGYREGVLLFSNAADGSKRIALTVRLSADNAKTWPRSLVLQPGPAAYSCLVDLGSGQAGCLYENGDKRPYERLTLARFALTDVTAGAAPAP